MLTVIQRIFVGVCVVALATCGPRPAPRVEPAVAGGLPAMIRVRVAVAGSAQVVSVPLEEYVLASALSEIVPPAGSTSMMARVFELQAIVARTYAVANRGRHAKEGFDLCDTTHCQLVDLERPRHSRWANIARAAVEATRGTAIFDGDRPASALFHADCGGHRAAASDVWGGRAGAYLSGGPDPLPSGERHLTWHFAIDREKLRAALNANPRTAVGSRLDTIDVQSRDRSGRARLVVLNGERAPLVRGEDFRASMSVALGPRAIRSSRFEVRRAGTTFIFDGEGFGHGVGLCQRGAVVRSVAGQSVKSILQFYFPGTTLKRDITFR